MITPSKRLRSPSRPSPRSRSWLLLSFLLAPLATGCVVNTGSKLTFSGKSIEDNLLRRVAPGESKELVLTLFGPPSSKGALGSGAEVWKWNYHEWATVQGPFLGLPPSEHQSTGSVNVEFAGRTVVRIWRS